MLRIIAFKKGVVLQGKILEVEVVKVLEALDGAPFIDLRALNFPDSEGLRLLITWLINNTMLVPHFEVIARPMQGKYLKVFDHENRLNIRTELPV